jgi:cell division inhibitor SepF
MWRKTMVYLGLVDETPQEAEAPPVGAPDFGAQAQPEPQPYAQPLAPVPDEPPPSAPPERRVVTSGLGQVEGRRVDPPSGSRRPPIAPVRDLESAEGATVRPVQSLDRQAEIIEPFTFEDAKQLADHIRERTPVVLNLRDVDPDLVRRIIDFSTGLTYALDGSMRKIGTAVILVLPPRVTLGREEKRRLASMGLYELEIEAR